MNKKILVTTLVVVVIVVILAFVMPSPDGNNSDTSDQNESETEEVSTSTEENIVLYSDSGFSPEEITVEVGEPVTFKNESSSGMWVASDLHPTHTNYQGTSLNEHCNDGTSSSFDACGSISSGGTWTFTFDKSGEWGYHNHERARDTGVVIVE